MFKDMALGRVIVAGLISLMLAALLMLVLTNDVNADSDNVLTRHIWALREFEGSKLPRAQPEAATLRFSPNGSFGGTRTCNGVGGEGFHWVADGDGRQGSFAIDESRPSIITTVGCPGRSGDRQAAAFWSSIGQWAEWKLVGGRLTIGMGNGDVAWFEALPPEAPRRPDPNDFDRGR